MSKRKIVGNLMHWLLISNIHADTEQQSHVEMIDTDIGIVYLSRDM